MAGIIPPIKWENDKLFLLDQRYLPQKEDLVEIKTIEECREAIEVMVVRGAPCIGFTAIFGMALWVKDKTIEELKNKIDEAAVYLKSARPTAVNLEFEIDRCVKIVNDNTGDDSFSKLVAFGLQQMEEAYESNLSMAKTAVVELKKTQGKSKFRLMHHCNTGYLACGTLGTALGVVSHMASNGLIEHVWVDETRPYMQGTRLTSYELIKQGVPHDIVVEGAASYLMREGKVDAVFVGADRITKNGDTANKIGTSTLAIAANFYKIPFYVVAPTSSFDLSSESGSDITIELRSQDEILSLKGQRLAPEGATALNPSFDITPNTIITGIICEKGIIHPPYWQNLEKVVCS